MMSGSLRTRVRIERQTEAQDAAGQLVNTWTTFATVWADVRNMRGVEVIKSGMQVSALKSSIRIRYIEGVTPDMRIMYGDRAYQIVSVSPDDAGREYVDLVCEKMPS